MTPYELKKLQVELKSVNTARETQELQIMGLQEQIERMQKSINVSIDKEKELEEKIKAAKAE